MFIDREFQTKLGKYLYGSISNDEEWDESKHPRAKDGKFGKGSGKSSSKKEKEKQSPKKEDTKKKTFKGFDLKEPERQNMKTPSLDTLYEGRSASGGAKSSEEYKSPKESTCNLVGYVALGKATKEMQKKLNEKIQTAEIILSDMGVRFKTPLDFVSQSLKSQSATFATFSPISKLNSRINFKAKSDFYSQAIMHEIGHAIDYAMNSLSQPASSKYKHDKDLSELKKLHKDLAEIVTSSDFYKLIPTSDKERKYINIPTEIFARAFEVYSYARGLDLIKQGKIPEEFLESFKPDIFKTKDALAIGMRDVILTNKKKNQDLFNDLKRVFDKEKRDALYKAYVKSVEENNKLREQLDSFSKNKNEIINEKKQKEYMDKISKIMDEILKKEPMKNAIKNITFQN